MEIAMGDQTNVQISKVLREKHRDDKRRCLGLFGAFRLGKGNKAEIKLHFRYTATMSSQCLHISLHVYS